MNKLIIRQLSSGGYQWQWFGDDPFDAPGNPSGSGDFNALQGVIGERQLTLWLLLPGEYFFTKSVAFSDQEKRHLRQALPYQLEELLIDDIDDLHFALGEPRNGNIAVAACRRDWLREQLRPFHEVEIDIARAVPDFLLLARPEGWALRLTGKSVLAHTACGEGFVMEPELALQGLKLLRADCSEEDIPVLIAAANPQALDQFEATLEGLPGLITEKRVQFWWQGIDIDTSPEIDLLQGEFGRRLPVERWWQQWRNVAIFAGVVLAGYLMVSGLQYTILEDRNLELRRQIEQVFRSVVPRGAIVDAEKQLLSKVKTRQGAGGSSAAVATLAKIAPLIAASEDVTLRALHYSGEEMRLSFWAQSFNAIEQLRANIAGLGMEVELVQASADGDGHQARLRIRGGVAG